MQDVVLEGCFPPPHLNIFLKPSPRKAAFLTASCTPILLWGFFSYHFMKHCLAPCPTGALKFYRMTLQSSLGSAPAQRAFAHNALLISCPPLCHPSTSMTSEALIKVYIQLNIFSTLFKAPVSTIRMWISLSLKMSKNFLCAYTY